jgi:hypothetical protein
VKRKIACVGLVCPRVSEVSWINFDSNESIQFADIVLFCPTTRDFYFDDKANLVLSEESSADYVRIIRHWKQELSEFLEKGKNVFATFSQAESFNYYGSEVDFCISKSERLVEGNILDCLPIKLPKSEVKAGNQIVLSRRENSFADYWQLMEKHSYFTSTLLARSVSREVFTVKGSDRVVGAVFEHGDGKLILLPPFDFKTTGNHLPHNDQMSSFFQALMSEIAKLDKSLNSLPTASHPEWTNENYYVTAEECALLSEIASTEAQIVILRERLASQEASLHETKLLKRLLYAQGKPLEAAVIDALSLMGFVAVPYKDSSSEFDVVFRSDEGDFLGEVEGKDRSAINIDKLSQLSRNVDEELFKRSDLKPAKQGVLFGNGFRLQKPHDREEQFTNKCLEVAKAKGFILVHTADLFPVAAYLRGTNDLDFARTCRTILMSAKGRIADFPDPPVTKQERTQLHHC